jgi:hypothetical protein
MDKISPIKKNILYFIENQSIIKEDFYRKTEMSASNFKQPGLKSEIGGDKITKILSVYPEINPGWLLTGQGEMLKENETQSNEGINYNRMPSVITVSKEDSGIENIEIVPAKLAAGYVGGGYENPDFIRELPKFRLPFLNGGTFRCFGIEGYSMENGIRDNDFFVGRFLDNIRELGEGKIHALIIPKLNTFLLKRVFRHPTDPDMIILRSDNNDIVNTYPDIHIHIRYIAEMWTYASTISFKEPYYDMEKFRNILLTQPQKVIYG